LKGDGMKVCLLFHKFDPEREGVSVNMDRLAKNLPSVEFHIITSKVDSNQEDILRTEIDTSKRANNIFVHRTGFINDIESESYPDGLDNFCYAIEELHKKHGFDLIHSFYLTPNGYIGTIMAKKLGIPSIIGIQGNDIGKNYLDYKRLFWIYWTLKNADYLLFLNKDLLQIADSIYPCKRKSKIILNSSFFPYPVKQKKLDKKHIIFGYWGDIKRKKGIIYLLDAVSEIHSKTFEVKILGDIYAAEKSIYMNEMSRLKLSDRVSFHKSI